MLEHTHKMFIWRDVLCIFLINFCRHMALHKVDDLQIQALQGTIILFNVVTCLLIQASVLYIILLMYQHVGVLQQHGLTEEVLKKAFLQSVHGLDLCWSLKEIPTVAFYRELHSFLIKWPPSSSVAKCTIGQFYINMDPELHRKYHSDCTCPDDIYKFIENIVSSNKHNSTQMSYGLGTTIQCLQEEVGGYSAQIQALSAKVLEQNEQLSVMRRKVKLVLSELGQTKQFLKDIADEMS